MNRQLLIDADIMVFQFACTNEQIYQWDEEVSSEVITLEDAIAEMKVFITTLQEATETTLEPPLMCLSSSKPNFRYSVLPTYKHNRKGKKKPTLHKALCEYLEANYETKIKPGLEADDVLGILSTLKPDKYVIASIDKDLLQIPGLHYNWRKDCLDSVTEGEGERFFYEQILMGDPTDGYGGCPGIGVKKAKKLLDSTPKDLWWKAIVDAYESKGLTEEDALVQARVAKILTKDDYCFETKKPILWLPTARR